jgi:anaerobic dimethyl sulfoxide reductase subunit C (anchor subunit)
MLRKEWSLIANSLLIQMAAGLFLFLGIFRLTVKDSADSKTMTSFIAPGMLLAGLLLVSGMFFSLFHLGNPFRAYRAVTNLRSSWLSREILFTGIFLGLWLVYFICEINGIYFSFLIWLTILAAILSVISMASIYYSTGSRGWNSISTYTGFLESVMILGSAGTVILIAGGEEMGPSLVGMLKISILLLAVFVATKLGQQVAMIFKLRSADTTRSVDNLVASTGLINAGTKMHKNLTLLGIALSIGGAVIALVVIGSAHLEAAGPYLIASAVFVLAGEFIGRAGFYSLGLTSDE